METRRDLSQLSFLYNKLSMPKMSLVYWLKVPEFVDAIFGMLQRSEVIDDSTVYPILVRLYEALEPLKGTPKTEGFSFAKMRQGIKKLHEALESGA